MAQDSELELGINTVYALSHAPIMVAGVGSERDWREAQATRQAYEAVGREIAAREPTLLVFVSPHGRLYRDSMHITGGASATADWLDFGRDPERYTVTYDEDFSAALLEAATAAHIPADLSPDPRLDHGCMVPLYFIRNGGLAAAIDSGACKLARISQSFLGDAAHYRMGRCVQHVARALNHPAQRTIFIASGDLSHKLKEDGPYGFNPAGPQFEAMIDRAFGPVDGSGLRELMGLSASFRDECGECGLSSFIMGAGVLGALGKDGRGAALAPVESTLFAHEGPWGVGYAEARLRVCPPK